LLGRRQIGFGADGIERIDHRHPWKTQNVAHDRTPKQHAEKHRCVVC